MPLPAWSVAAPLPVTFSFSVPDPPMMHGAGRAVDLERVAAGSAGERDIVRALHVDRIVPAAVCQVHVDAAAGSDRNGVAPGRAFSRDFGDIIVFLVRHAEAGYVDAVAAVGPGVTVSVSLPSVAGLLFVALAYSRSRRRARY